MGSIADTKPAVTWPLGQHSGANYRQDDSVVNHHLRLSVLNCIKDHLSRHWHSSKHSFHRAVLARLHVSRHRQPLGTRPTSLVIDRDLGDPSYKCIQGASCIRRKKISRRLRIFLLKIARLAHHHLEMAITQTYVDSLVLSGQSICERTSDQWDWQESFIWLNLYRMTVRHAGIQLYLDELREMEICVKEREDEERFRAQESVKEEDELESVVDRDALARLQADVNELERNLRAYLPGFADKHDKVLTERDQSMEIASTSTLAESGTSSQWSRRLRPRSQEFEAASSSIGGTTR